jgi:hypothetical protein
MGTAHCNCIQNLDVMLHFFCAPRSAISVTELSQNRYFSFISPQFLTNKLFVSVEDFQVRTTSHIDLELAYGLFEILRRYNACPCTVVYPHPREIRS